MWLILAGRGYGKTRTGAEWVRSEVETSPLVNVIGATADDARDIMIDGESGILAVCPAWERPTYRKSERALLWPNGAKTLIFTADEPERLRGKQHMKLWADELAAWRYPEAWDQAMLGLRLGESPQAVVTTTPRPTPLIKALVEQAGGERPTVALTRGTSYENRGNLAPAFYREIIRRYEGTRLGRQELEAALLDDNPLALWQRGRIDELRVTKHPDLKRVVVAVDPGASDGTQETAAECGIVVGGVAPCGCRGTVEDHGFILDDLSLRASPLMWARQAVTGFHKYRADRLVAEQNNGGAMVEATLKTVEARLPYKGLHASRGKQTRAEPVAALYEQGKVHHVGGFPLLEDQLCEWVPGDTSPDRLDALVWALTELMLGGRREAGGY